MKNLFLMISKKFSAATLAVCALVFPAFASTDNPNTGDAQGRIIPIIIGVAGVALLVVIIMAVTSGKNKKKRKK